MNSGSALRIKDLADVVVRRGMAIPAIFVLEMYKPLQNLFCNGALLSAPIMIPLFGAKHYKEILLFLDSSEKLEDFIQLIEQRSKLVEVL